MRKMIFEEVFEEGDVIVDSSNEQSSEETNCGKHGDLSENFGKANYEKEIKKSYEGGYQKGKDDKWMEKELEIIKNNNESINIIRSSIEKQTEDHEKFLRSILEFFMKTQLSIMGIGLSDSVPRRTEYFISQLMPTLSMSIDLVIESNYKTDEIIRKQFGKHFLDRVSFCVKDSMLYGDIRIRWKNGSAEQISTEISNKLSDIINSWKLESNK